MSLRACFPPRALRRFHAADDIARYLAARHGLAEDRAERRIDELQDELTRERCRAAALGRKLIEVLTGPRVPWWRRWFR